MVKIPSTQMALADLLTEVLGKTASNGEDSDKRPFQTVSALWKAKLPSTGIESDWYAGGSKYWSDVEADDYSGVLGGQQHVHDWDIAASDAFIAGIVALRPQVLDGAACDVGAGMGRVSESLLVKRFSGGVHVVEPSAKLLAAARKRLGGNPLALNFVGTALQKYSFPPGLFSCVWMQWVAGALLDIDLLRVLREAGSALRKGGVIVFKENLARHAAGFWYDNEDCYIVRGRAYTEALFKLAGLTIMHVADQAPWDDELLPVRMYALAPME